MPNIIPLLLALVYVFSTLIFFFYFCVCLVRVYSCLVTDCVEIIKLITTDLSERAKKRKRVHCIVIEYTPEARVVDSTTIVPFTIAVPDALEIEED